MLTVNLRPHYKHSVRVAQMATLLLSLMLSPFYSFFLLPSSGPFFYGGYARFQLILGLGVLITYLQLKIFGPYYFYKTLMCPRCNHQYHHPKHLSAIRLDVLNLSPCDYCDYQGHFEI